MILQLWNVQVSLTDYWKLIEAIRNVVTLNCFSFKASLGRTTHYSYSKPNSIYIGHRFQAIIHTMSFILSCRNAITQSNEILITFKLKKTSQSFKFQLHKHNIHYK